MARWLETTDPCNFVLYQLFLRALRTQSESLDGVIAGASWGKPAFEENDFGYASLAEIAPLERLHERCH